MNRIVVYSESYPHVISEEEVSVYWGKNGEIIGKIRSGSLKELDENHLQFYNDAFKSELEPPIKRNRIPFRKWRASIESLLRRRLNRPYQKSYDRHYYQSWWNVEEGYNYCIKEMFSSLP